MTDRELMQMALDALELLARYENPSTKVQVRKPRDGGPIVTMYPHKVATEAAVPLRARLAHPEQEPVAWCIVENGRVHGLVKNKPAVMNAEKWQPLYTASPQREWQGLTDENWIEIIERPSDKKGCEWDAETYSIIEAKLKEKNA